MPSPEELKSLQVFGYDYAYLDSGPPPASTNYATWVILHGLGFNGAVFEKILAIAHAHHLRIVSVYRRSYPPSSGFTEDELKGIGFGKKFDEADPFFRAQGVEIATFLATFATEQGIPLTVTDPNTGKFIGGIVLIGWSLASVHVLTVLAYADELPEDAQSTLRKYLHTVLSHDPTTVPLGIPNTELHRGDLSLWTETDDRKRFDAFYDWVAAHYVHKSVTSGDVEDLNFRNPSDDVPRSLHELSDAQRANYTCLEPFKLTGCDWKLTFTDTSAFVELSRRALFDKTRAEILPSVRLRYMSGGTSPAILVWSSWMIRKNVERPEELYGPRADEERARDVKYINQLEGNHFIFWEDPEKAIDHYTACINL